MTNPAHLARLFGDQGHVNDESRYPVRGVITDHDGSTAAVLIPAFDGGKYPFPIDYASSPPLQPGDIVLVCKDEADTYWVIATQSSSGGTGSHNSGDGTSPLSGPGITNTRGLTVKGVPINRVQVKQANILLSRAKSDGAPELAARALLCAAIGESTLTNLSTPNSAGYWGVLQGGSGESGSSANFPAPDGWDDSDGMAKSFLHGGRGFGNGWTGGTVGTGVAANGRGAIELAGTITDPGEIATAMEDSGALPSFYGTYDDEAKKIIATFNGN